MEEYLIIKKKKVIFLKEKKISNKKYQIKYIIHFILFIIFLIVICYYNKNDLQYIDILPKTNFFYHKPKSIKEVFNCRRLFIDKVNITNDYIRYIRPVSSTNKTIEINKAYQELKFDENYFIKRKDQYNFSEFRQFCDENSLLKFNKIIAKRRPLISVILPTYNNGEVILKSLRSIQAQSLKNIEIIIVDDSSSDFNISFYKSILKSDSRIRIFSHLENMGVWRSRIDGFLYSRGKYVIHFDTGDLYEDNYVLEDLYNIIEKYNLDSVKTFFRTIYDLKNFSSYNIEINTNINYTQIINKSDIERYNSFIMGWAFGIIWNRLTRNDIYTKGLYLLSDTILNFHKSLWEDRWWSKLADVVSENFLIVKRFGYLYFRNNNGAGTPKTRTNTEKDRMIQEFLYFLYFDYELMPPESDKSKIIKHLKRLNRKRRKIALRHLKTNFYLLDNLLNILLKDPCIKREEDKIYLYQLLVDSQNRQSISFVNKN